MRSLGQRLWPRRIEAISERQILIEMREVEINGELPDGAFTRRAGNSG